MAANAGASVQDFMRAYLYGFIFVKRVLTSQELSDLEAGWPTSPA